MKNKYQSHCDVNKIGSNNVTNTNPINQGPALDQGEKSALKPNYLAKKDAHALFRQLSIEWRYLSRVDPVFNQNHNTCHLNPCFYQSTNLEMLLLRTNNPHQGTNLLFFFSHVLLSLIFFSNMFISFNNSYSHSYLMGCWSCFQIVCSKNFNVLLAPLKL